MRKRNRLWSVAGLIVGAVVMVSGCLAQPVADEGLGSQALPAYGLLTTRQAADVVVALREDPGFVLLDIRTPAETTAGHIAGAVELDFRSASFADELAKLDRDDVYLIYCRTGNRTGEAFGMMSDLGFEKVYDMGGGITQWIAAGYPICIGALDSEHVCDASLPTLP